MRATSLFTVAVVALLPPVIAGCSSDDSAPTPAASGGASSGGSAGASGAGGTQVVRISDAEAKEGRESCRYQSGALAAETLGESVPIGNDIPIEHVLILMMENRSFDHYFSELPAYGVTDVDVAPAGFSNPDLSGSPVARFHDTRYCVEDPNHGWSGSHDQYGGGAMDGFVRSSSGPAGTHAMGYFDHTDIPFYYELAATFGISDTYFGSLLGPTWPNRMYLYSGSSHGLTANSLPVSEVPNIFQSLLDTGVSFKSYRDNLEPAAMFVSSYIQGTSGCSFGEEPCAFVDLGQLFPDLASGNLPQVSFINPELVTGINETSEHPPGNVQLGQHFIWQVVDALTRSPAWGKTALFITYDEHGGFHDHVPPPAACAPTVPGGASIDPSEPSSAALGTFDQLGFRVPVYVVSPYAKRSYVSHVTHDHTSILRFVQARFGLPAYTGRDANAAAMMDFFDFDDPPFATPPTFAEPSIDAAARARCESEFSSGAE